MLKFTRYIVGIVVLLVAVGLVVRWALGEDFRPWVRVARQTAAEKFAKLVDQYEMELEKARIAYEKARDRAGALRAQKYQAAAGVKVIERELKVAQQEITDAKGQLANLEAKLSRGESVRLVSGRVAAPAELKGFVADFANRIQIAQEKVGHLEQFHASRQTRYQKLAELQEQSPAAIQRLHNSVDHLAQKVELYREVKRWAAEEAAAESELTGMYEQAQRTLEEAHAKLDQKLAEIDALLDASLQPDIAPAREPATTESVLSDIRTILGNKMLVAEN